MCGERGGGEGVGSTFNQNYINPSLTPDRLSDSTPDDCRLTVRLFSIYCRFSQFASQQAGFLGVFEYTTLNLHFFHSVQPNQTNVVPSCKI